MDPHLALTMARQREEAISRRAAQLGPQLAALREPARQGPSEPLTVRLASPDDGPALIHLAELDEAPPPAAPVLIGERSGRAVAALSLRDGAVVANPFVPAADVIALLRLRARQLRAGASHPRRAWLPLRSRPQRAG